VSWRERKYVENENDRKQERDYLERDCENGDDVVDLIDVIAVYLETVDFDGTERRQ
jgi:hypothetical protein